MDVAVFIICSGSKAGQQLKFPLGSYSVGRAPTCSLQVQGDDVSRMHCELSITTGGVVLRDLKSRNGTYFNDCRIDEPVMLSIGHRFRVGKLELELVSTDSQLEPDSPRESSSSPPVDPNKMTLDELVQFDDEPVDLNLEPIAGTPESQPSDQSVGNFGTTILAPGQLNQIAGAPTPARKEPSEEIDTTQAAKIALRKIMRGPKH